MHLFDVNDVKVSLNPADLKDDVYVSLSIGIGFLPRQISHNKETIFIGSAAAKLFLNYVSTYIKTNHSIETTPVISTTSSSLLVKTSTAKFLSDVQTILDILFTIDIDEEEWLVEKGNTLDRFKKNYKDLNFRGRMKLQEFTHANKSFKLDELTKDLLDVDLDTIHTMRKSLFYPKNCFLFIHGNIDVEIVKNLKVEKFTDKKVVQLYEPVDIYELHDEKLVVKSKGNYTAGSIKFDREPTLTDLAKEYVVLSIIGQILVKGAYLIEVDPLDASLVYNDRLAQYKHDVFTAITDANVKQAIKDIYQSLYQELVLYPFQFIEKVGRLHFNRINYFEAMSILETINQDDMMEFLKARDYKIREGHLRYYKEG